MNPEESRGAAVDLLRHLLALLRAQYWSYQQGHWQVRGGNFYGNHLLFQRLYESVVEQTDVLAEKMVGTYGGGAVASASLEPPFKMFLARWNKAQCPHKRGLLSEMDLQELIKTVYRKLREADELSLGMDDFLLATASEHETNQYLLRQVLRSKESAGE